MEQLVKTKKFLLLCLTVGLLTLLACSSGGSSGTGGRRFEGVVISRTGEPLPGVRLSALETGDETVTDERGLFVLDASTSPGDVAVGVDGDGFSATITVNEVPDSAVRIVIEVEVDQDTGAASVVEVEIKTDDDDSSEDEDGDNSGSGVAMTMTMKMMIPMMMGTAQAHLVPV